MSPQEPIEPAQAVNWLRHLKENRLEVLVALMFIHAVGATDLLMSQLNGVCF